jgi:hypothetical protein
MVTRMQTEEMILHALVGIHTVEEDLSRRFSRLATARPQARIAFHNSVQELGKRTDRLEQLFMALEQLKADAPRAASAS